MAVTPMPHLAAVAAVATVAGPQAPLPLQIMAGPAATTAHRLAAVLAVRLALTAQRARLVAVAVAVVARLRPEPAAMAAKAVMAAI
jgi:hypothetical protein